jgi:hypothetical protein
MAFTKPTMAVFERYDPEKVAGMAIRAAPCLTMAAIFKSLTGLTVPLHPAAWLREFGCPAQEIKWCEEFRCLKGAIQSITVRKYSPLEDQVLDITSIYKDENSPCFKGTIELQEVRDIFQTSAMQYMDCKKRIRKHRYRFGYHEDNISKIAHYSLAKLEIEATKIKYGFSLMDLATMYKNHLGLEFPNCNEMDTSDEQWRKNWRGYARFGCGKPCFGFWYNGTYYHDEPTVLDGKDAMYRNLVDQILQAGLFGLPTCGKWEDEIHHGSLYHYHYPDKQHVKYLALAILHGGLNEEEADDAIASCIERKWFTLL